MDTQLSVVGSGKKTMKEMELNVMKRVEANDPVAMCHKGKMCNIDGDYDGALNICRRQLNWVKWDHTMNYQICIHWGKALRGTRKNSCIIWKRLQLGGTLQLDSILEQRSGTIAGWRGQ